MPEPSHTVTSPPEDVAAGALTSDVSADLARSGKPRSLWSDAWHDLRRNPMFVISALLIVFLIVVAAFPGLFTSTDPKFCDLAHYNGGRAPGTRSGSTGRAATSTPG
jgi:peptide/nickel transport system permease protein/oligopeptide transport system permease protein